MGPLQLRSLCEQLRRGAWGGEGSPSLLPWLSSRRWRSSGQWGALLVPHPVTESTGPHSTRACPGLAPAASWLVPVLPQKGPRAQLIRDLPPGHLHLEGSLVRFPVQGHVPGLQIGSRPWAGGCGRRLIGVSPYGWFSPLPAPSSNVGGKLSAGEESQTTALPRSQPLTLTQGRRGPSVRQGRWHRVVRARGLCSAASRFTSSWRRGRG